MNFKNLSPYQKIRALIANKLTLPLTVLDSLAKGNKVNNKVIAKASNELNKVKKLLVMADKKWIQEK